MTREQGTGNREHRNREHRNREHRNREQGTPEQGTPEQGTGNTGTGNREQGESFGRFYFSSHTFKFLCSPTYYPLPITHYPFLILDNSMHLPIWISLRVI
jgi:hypothetical protein